MELPVVALDFESYYDPQFSLKKLATEEYIRSPLFEAIGISIWHADAVAPIWYPRPQIEQALRAIDWKNTALLAHNAWFDGAIASWHYGIRPKLFLDTMAMGQPLFGLTTGVGLGALSKALGTGEKGTEVVRAIGKRYADFTPTELAVYGQYCCNDTWLTRKNFEKLLPLTPRKELALIDDVIRMFTEPVLRLDMELLREYHEHVVHRKQVQYIWLGNLLGRSEEEVKTGIMSDGQLAQMLMNLGVDPPTKLNSKGIKKYAFAKTDQAFLDLEDHPDEAVQMIVAARLGGKSTLAESRAARLIGVAERGLLPVMLRYYAGHTGRFGGGDKLNLQNLPRNTPDTPSKLRHAIMAPPYHHLVVADLSQIEARVLAYVSGQHDVLQIFAANDRDPANHPDVYCATATMLFGRPITKADKLERFVGKTARLGLGYGTGKDKFFITLRKDKVPCTAGQAEAWVAKFREASPWILKLWRDSGRALDALLKGESFTFGYNNMFEVKSDGIHMPNGLVLRYPGLECEMQDKYGNGKLSPQYSYLNRKKRTKIYGAKVVENLVQSLARSVCTDAWLQVKRKYKVVLQAHDELISVCLDDQVEDAKVYVAQCMTQPVPWLPGMPIACEVDAARRYGEAK